jgi:hypothetical protein
MWIIRVFLDPLFFLSQSQLRLPSQFSGRCLNFSRVRVHDTCVSGSVPTLPPRVGDFGGGRLEIWSRDANGAI